MTLIEHTVVGSPEASRNKGRDGVLFALPFEYSKPFDHKNVPHIPSHRGLIENLGVVEPSRRPKTKLDAVIVPTSRIPTNLDASANVAQFSQSQLIYLCSGEATVDGGFDFLTDHNIDTHNVMAVQVPEEHRLTGVQLDTDNFPIPGYTKTRDLNTKRNIGLAVACMVGWRHIMFLDDDIQGLQQPHLSHALNGFECPDGSEHPDRQIVGWGYSNPFDEFANDNSVAMHAYRLAGGVQDIFIGGGANIVRVSDDIAFFPNIYNEDWFFFAAMMQKGQPSVAIAGELEQIPKNPFARKEVTIEEEFGDTLAEGLFRTMYGDRSLTDPSSFSPTWWEHIVQMRKDFLNSIADRL